MKAIDALEMTWVRHFLFLSDSCLYMVHLGLGFSFLKVAKKSGNIGFLEKSTEIAKNIYKSVKWIIDFIFVSIFDAFFTQNQDHFHYNAPLMPFLGSQWLLNQKVKFLIYWYVKISICIHNLWKFSEDKILQTWIFVKNIWKYPKNAIKSRTLHNLQSHLAYRYIKLCILIRYTFCESLVNICVTKHKCH